MPKNYLAILNEINFQRFYLIKGFYVVKDRLDIYVDGYQLDPKVSQKIFNHSPDGFSAGYYGSGPAQSALAICLHIFNDKDLVYYLYQQFKNDYLSKPEYQKDDFRFEFDAYTWAAITIVKMGRE